MVRVELYGKPDCPLCDEAWEVLARLKADVPFDLVKVDVTQDPAVHAKYQYDVPVVFVDGRKAFKHRVDPKEARKRIERALTLTEGAEIGERPAIPAGAMRRIKIAFAIVVMISIPGLLGLKAWSVFVEQPRLAEEAFDITRADVDAPGLRVATRDGKGWAPGDDRGQVVFVNFWATWCAPCKDELPSMVQLGRQLEAAHPGKFKMVAVSIDTDWKTVQQFFSGAAPRELTLGLDTEQKAMKAWYCGARGHCPDAFKVPETYVLDKQGRLKAYVVGPRDWSEPAAKRFLERLIES